ncbi:hypothetical protein MG293_001745 [Ovis ammon polii]|uniref:Uncharacterized protein n=1 Tax=Ovis ammon polii TaxID=230172 RepID=A0AAD4YFX0_OVIAM|nr:hypothetical protein MG293_001745 [Ovis ammon polii]
MACILKFLKKIHSPAVTVFLASHHLPIGSCLWKCSELENEIFIDMYYNFALGPSSDFTELTAKLYRTVEKNRICGFRGKISKQQLLELSKEKKNALSLREPALTCILQQLSAALFSIKHEKTRVQFLGQEDPPGEGNGNLLQYSCLENSMDGGPWCQVKPTVMNQISSSFGDVESIVLKIRDEVHNSSDIYLMRPLQIEDYKIRSKTQYKLCKLSKLKN